jgi:hypothetical protein
LIDCLQWPLISFAEKVQTGSVEMLSQGIRHSLKSPDLTLLEGIDALSALLSARGVL